MLQVLRWQKTKGLATWCAFTLTGCISSPVCMYNAAKIMVEDHLPVFDYLETVD